MRAINSLGNLYSEESIDIGGGDLTIDGIMEVNNNIYLNSGAIRNATITGLSGRMFTSRFDGILDGVTFE